MMLTAIKVSVQDQVKLRSQAEVIAWQPHGIIVASTWTKPLGNLGCTRFEPGDRFTEDSYSDRCCNIQEVRRSAGVRKGWYCDIAEPAVIDQEQVRLGDLELDVWISIRGRHFILETATRVSAS